MKARIIIPTTWKPLIVSAPMVPPFMRDEKTNTRRIKTSDTPAYQPGDGLWVREPVYRFRTVSEAVDCQPGFVRFRANDHGLDMPWIKENGKDYKQDGLAGRYMRRVWCRTLGVCTSVRAERVASITFADILAEGIACPAPHDAGARVRTAGNFAKLWNTLHDKPGERFDDNPWVWVYGIKHLMTDHVEAQRILGEKP